jgi:THAP domain
VYTQKFDRHLFYEGTRICSLHFKDTDFADAQHQKLKPNAVPTIHKYSYYFTVAELKTKPVKQIQDAENGDICPIGVCLLCLLLSKWKIKLKAPAVPVKLFRYVICFCYFRILRLLLLSVSRIPKDGSAWRAAIRMIHMDKAVPDDTVICSLHFRDSDYVDDSQTLKADAVPVVHKYGYYFNIALPKQKKMKDFRVACLICPLLKKWNIALKRTSTDPITQFA